jgi:lysophospholipase L1-like esterase
MRADMRSALKILVANVLVFFTLIVIVEGGVRLFCSEILPQNLDPNLFDPFKYPDTYGYKRSSRGNEFGATYVTDEHGFRINSNSLRSKTHTKNGSILLLGDSVSVGIGVNSEEGYPYLLEKKFPDQHVFNASVTGYGISNYIAALHGTISEVEPDQIVIGFCLNDVSVTSQVNILAMIQKRKGTTESIPDEKRYPNLAVRWLRYINDNYFNFNDALKKYSRAYLLLKSVATDSARDYFAADEATYKDPQTLDFLTTEFIRLKESTNTYNASLVIFVFPYEYQLRTLAEGRRLPQKIIQEAGRRAEVAVYDLYDDLLNYLRSNGAPSKSIYLFNDPMHFNARGHQVIADVIYARLTKVRGGLANSDRAISDSLAQPKPWKTRQTEEQAHEKDEKKSRTGIQGEGGLGSDQGRQDRSGVG